MAATPKRLEVLDMAEYYTSSTQVAVKKGNPSNIDVADLCGQAIGVSNGSYQMNNILPGLSDECVADGKDPIKIDAFPDQQKAVLAVLSGRISAGALDGPIVQYMLTKEPGLENAGTLGTPSPTTIGIEKGNELGTAVAEALQHLMDDGTYQQILEKWGIQELGVAEAKVLR
jgi:polar amino acid transport system substrate-binding protein